MTNKNLDNTNGWFSLNFYLKKLMPLKYISCFLIMESEPESCSGAFIMSLSWQKLKTNNTDYITLCKCNRWFSPLQKLMSFKQISDLLLDHTLKVLF